jgi:hypothetical protein
MPLHQGDIIAIKQPIYLLTCEGNQLIRTPWPFEFLLGKRFVIKHKTVVFPEQALDFVALFIGEDVQLTTKRIVAEF